MSVDPANQEAALPFRVYGLEGQVKTMDASLARLDRNVSGHSEAISAQAVTLAKHDEQLGTATQDRSEIKSDVAVLAAAMVTLGEKVATSSNRIAWTFASFALSALGGTIIVLVTR